MTDKPDTLRGPYVRRSGIGILIAVDAIPDLFATVLNASGDLAAAVLVARYSAVKS